MCDYCLSCDVDLSSEEDFVDDYLSDDFHEDLESLNCFLMVDYDVRGWILN